VSSRLRGRCAPGACADRVRRWRPVAPGARLQRDEEVVETPPAAQSRHRWCCRSQLAVRLYLASVESKHLMALPVESGVGEGQLGRGPVRWRPRPNPAAAHGSGRVRSRKPESTSGRCSLAAGARWRKGSRRVEEGLQPVRGLVGVGPWWRQAAEQFVRAGAPGGSGGSPPVRLRSCSLLRHWLRQMWCAVGRGLINQSPGEGISGSDQAISRRQSDALARLERAENRHH
jgi:hypothetical protein